MKGYRFYQEFNSPKDKRKNNPNGNVFAAALKDDGGFEYQVKNGKAYGEGLGAMFYGVNSPVAYTSFMFDWLSSHCKRISEAKARVIHPELFKRLDND